MIARRGTGHGFGLRTERGSERSLRHADVGLGWWRASRRQAPRVSRRRRGARGGEQSTEPPPRQVE